MAKVSTKKIEIPALNKSVVKVAIEGETPIIFHQFGEKAKKHIQELESQAVNSKMRKPRGEESINDEYKCSLYVTKDGYIGFPARNIKNAMVRAAKQVGIAMTDIKSLFFVHSDDGELVCVRRKGEKLRADKMDNCEMREDRVRVGHGQTTMRYRAMMREWDIDLRITFEADLLTPETIVNLLQRAGMGGLGEWRPTAPKNPGDFGRFTIKQ